jgi:ribosomal protein S18 acetylase RimI-like enzyme
MTDEELAEWLPRARAEYADSMMRDGGVDEERARAKAEADFASMLPGAKPGLGQWVFAIESAGERVGELWLGERDDELSRGALWVYDVEIDAARRGRGLGRAAMLLAEDEARRRGCERVVLNVFARNEVARGLYRSLGYEESSVLMAKRL